MIPVKCIVEKGRSEIIATVRNLVPVVLVAGSLS